MFLHRIVILLASVINGLLTENVYLELIGLIGEWDCARVEEIDR